MEAWKSFYRGNVEQALIVVSTIDLVLYRTIKSILFFMNFVFKRIINNGKISLCLNSDKGNLINKYLNTCKLNDSIILSKLIDT